MPSYMAALKVGLTPYGDNEFNRASFPLKTLEYLSAGIAVVRPSYQQPRCLIRNSFRLLGPLPPSLRQLAMR